MLFKRKIYNKFLAWKQEANGQKALLVEGARRIGKSTVVEEFAKTNIKAISSLTLQRPLKMSRAIFNCI